MFLKQFSWPSLGHASYLIGDTQSGTALVLDPRRDVDDYFATARAEGLRITHAIDTHGHNDYLSGLAEIARRADVTVLGFAGADLGYAHRPVRDGEVLELGDLALEVLHTPGHTPEHVALLASDRAVSDEPAVLLSGGALLVGDIARPDLLGGDDAAARGARQTATTLRERILALPDHVEVFPTHVAGSLCGGNIGERLSTTVGYERRTNRVLREIAAGERDAIPLENLPAVPPYWRRMRPQNLAGVAPLGVLREPPALLPADVETAVGRGATVLDTRAPEAFGGGHIPGALNVGLGSSFATWAGTVIPEGAAVVLVVDRPDDVWSATWELLRIGYAPPVGWLAGGMRAWRTTARPVRMLRQITVHDLHELLDDPAVSVLDVRQPAEWAAGHIAGATFVSGAELPARLDDVPKGLPVAVVCGSGYRSSVAASLLLSEGRDVVNTLGGMAAWEAASFPVDD